MRRSNRAVKYSLLILLIACLVIPMQGKAQSPNQAGLVIEFGDGSLYTGCTSFEAKNISGYDLLASSGLSLETAFDPSQGIAVCKIGSDGCPADDCFCQMPEYWSYWNWQGDSWSYAGSGSSQNRVGNGDIDGWSWGAGSPPPVVPFNRLCDPPTPPPPTETPLPSPTHTSEPQPSDTPEPEPTDTFIPPTYTTVPTHTALPDSPTPEPSPSPMITSVVTNTSEPRAFQLTSVTLPDPTHIPTEVINTPSSTPTQTKISPLSPTPETMEAAKDESSSMVSYAIFGALLIGLGLTLTRIILKGQRP